MNAPPARLISILVVALSASMSTAVLAQSSPSALKARCSQLFAYYDWYGASRSENSDGARNHTRMRAAMECGDGNYQEGIAMMEGLLRRKKFDVPPASLAQVPEPAKPPVQ
jgi:hypothetical protein